MKQENTKHPYPETWKSFLQKMMPSDMASAMLFLAIAFFLVVLLIHFFGKSSPKAPLPPQQTTTQVQAPVSTQASAPAITASASANNTTCVTVTDEEIIKGLTELGEVVAVEEAAPGLRRWRVKIRQANPEKGLVEAEFKVFQSGNWLFVGAAHRPDGALADASLLSDQQVEELRSMKQAAHAASEADAESPAASSTQDPVNLTINAPGDRTELPPVYASLQKMQFSI